MDAVRYMVVLVLGLAILAGIVLPLSVEFVFPHNIRIVGAYTEVEDLSGLPVWVAFYRQFPFGFIPLGTVGLGASAVLMSRVPWRRLYQSVLPLLSRVGFRALRPATMAVLMVMAGILGAAIYDWGSGLLVEGQSGSAKQVRQPSEFRYPTFQEPLGPDIRALEARINRLEVETWRFDSFP